MRHSRKLRQRDRRAIEVDNLKLLAGVEGVAREEMGVQPGSLVTIFLTISAHLPGLVTHEFTVHVVGMRQLHWFVELMHEPALSFHKVVSGATERVGFGALLLLQIRHVRLFQAFTAPSKPKSKL